MQRESYRAGMIFAAAAVGMASVLTAGFQAPEAPSFNRYQPILQRMPFGPPPPDPGTVVTAVDTKSAAQDLKEQQLLARQINMSCVNITPSGKPAVGFTDLSSKPPVNYYILVGGDAGGWTLKSASYAEEWAELEKDGITIFVKLGQGLMADPPAKADNSRDSKKNLSLPKKDPVAINLNSPQTENKVVLLSPEEQFVQHKSIELADGIPSPAIEPGHFTEEETASVIKLRREMLKARQAGQDISSYKERLQAKLDQATIEKEARDSQVTEELKKIAEQVAIETLEERLRETEGLLDKHKENE